MASSFSLQKALEGQARAKAARQKILKDQKRRLRLAKRRAELEQGFKDPPQIRRRFKTSKHLKPVISKEVYSEEAQGLTFRLLRPKVYEAWLYSLKHAQPGEASTLTIGRFYKEQGTPNSRQLANYAMKHLTEAGLYYRNRHAKISTTLPALCEHYVPTQEDYERYEAMGVPAAVMAQIKKLAAKAEDRRNILGGSPDATALIASYCEIRESLTPGYTPTNSDRKGLAKAAKRLSDLGVPRAYWSDYLHYAAESIQSWCDKKLFEAPGAASEKWIGRFLETVGPVEPLDFPHLCRKVVEEADARGLIDPNYYEDDVQNFEQVIGEVYLAGQAYRDDDDAYVLATKAIVRENPHFIRKGFAVVNAYWRERTKREAIFFEPGHLVPLDVELWRRKNAKEIWAFLEKNNNSMLVVSPESAFEEAGYREVEV